MYPQVQIEIYLKAKANVPAEQTPTPNGSNVGDKSKKGQIPLSAVRSETVPVGMKKDNIKLGSKDAVKAPKKKGCC